MTKFNVILNQSVNDIMFGEERYLVRKRISEKFSEFKKTSFDTNTTDSYQGFHVFYDDKNCFEAIEIFKGEIYCNGTRIFPGTVENAKKVIDDLVEDDFGIISEKYSVGITTDEDNENDIDAILFGKKNYYKL